MFNSFKGIPVKLQTLLMAVALVAAGSAFAASDTTPAGSTSSAGKPTTTASHKAKTKVKKTSHKTAHHASASTHHMGNSSGRRSVSAATPATDLRSSDRQSRIDDAYNKWRSTHS